ncbi:sigma-70 family RNA polymerase sigma factor [Phytohabitans sp. ZYX-F-186]|uniref:Sigma-70 family RNA polymerase sigma factor n=1 Tax=Phytohabitans maris TaxID=3071409 RepID=A0ABU0ZVM5_9ACTN|nr:sigma-70 family RNA polymerase sigma factor [Phytohabitans sp. ZYX-F-186]MDQ7910988.1 sigma-70 family RNA polymerase sigma factor [Phytohabitans sp. ZYX-F-186]
MSYGEDGSDRPDDQELVLAVRQGEVDGFAVLYRKYFSHAHRAAARWADNLAEREDIVSEAFGRLLAKIQEGGGPRGDFLPYLIRVVRNVAIDRVRRERYVDVYDDLEHIEASRPVAPPDPVIAAWQRNALARALASLPARWQSVLWQVEVEGQTPAKVAPALGLSANAVAALAYRAREGLRQAYLQMHVQHTDVPACDKTTQRLGAWVRGGLSDRGSAEVLKHLRYCADCQQRADTVLELNGELTGAKREPVARTYRDAFPDAHAEQPRSLTAAGRRAG